MFSFLFWWLTKKIKMKAPKKRGQRAPQNRGAEGAEGHQEGPKGPSSKKKQKQKFFLKTKQVISGRGNREALFLWCAA
jgi:hypothetical protein